MENNSEPLDSLLHALADPTRRAVVQALVRGEASVSTLAEPFDMGLPAFLKHISILEDAGLVETQKAGRVRTCTLRPEALDPLEAWVGDQRARWASRFGKLDTLLNTLKGRADGQ